MDWAKFLSREFLIAVVLIIIASVAMFVGMVTFEIWAAACGGFAAIYTTGHVKTKITTIKANGNGNGG